MPVQVSNVPVATASRHLAHILLVAQSHLHIVEFCVSELLTHLVERMLEFIFQSLGVGPAILGSSCRHVEA